MNRYLTLLLFVALWLVGFGLAASSATTHGMMQAYAITMAIALCFVVFMQVRNARTKLLSCYTVGTLTPIWFLYLEAIFPGGDCWLLPPQQVVHAMSYAAFFLLVFNAAYVARPPRFVIRFHERNFLRTVSPVIFPMVGIALTVITFIAVLARYGWDWEHTKNVYLAGRAAGSGLIRRGGIGGWEVFMQPLDFMCASVPTIAALSWVRFPRERMAPLLMRVAVSLCAAFLVFVMFLGGSRGNMAVYLAGPAAIWLFFGRSVVGRVPHLVITVLLMLGLLGIWEYQKQKRMYLLEDVESVSDILEQTTFDPSKTHRDNNLYIMTLYVMYMPEIYPFKGYDEFFGILCMPIPRVLWPGKPKGIQANKATFATATGPVTRGPIKMGTASLSASIVNDGYYTHHYFGIALYAAIFGLLASFWDYIGQRRLVSSKLYFVLNSAWLFWMLWGFRSAFAFITGMYPVLGAYLLCYVASKAGVRIKAQHGGGRRAFTPLGSALPAVPKSGT
jgi:hypothetical protein